MTDELCEFGIYRWAIIKSTFTLYKTRKFFLRTLVCVDSLGFNNLKNWNNIFQNMFISVLLSLAASVKLLFVLVKNSPERKNKCLNFKIRYLKPVETADISLQSQRHQFAYINSSCYQEPLCVHRQKQFTEYTWWTKLPLLTKSLKQ